MGRLFLPASRCGKNRSGEMIPGGPEKMQALPGTFSPPLVTIRLNGAILTITA